MEVSQSRHEPANHPPLVGGYRRLIARMLSGKEVFVEPDMEFSRKDLLRVKCVVIPKLLQDFLRIGAGASRQAVKNFQVRRASRRDQVADVGCEDLVDFDPSYRGPGLPEPCALDMLANVERFTGHIAVPRLAQGRDRFSPVFNLTHG